MFEPGIELNIQWNNVYSRLPHIQLTLSMCSRCHSATSGRGAGDPSCVVLAVMGLDLTHSHFSQLLYQAIPDCTQTDDMR